MQLNVEKKEEKIPIKTQSFSLKEEEVLKKRLALLEDIRDEKEIVQGVSYESRDPQKIEAEMAAIKKELAFRSVKAATGNDRIEVIRELKTLEQELRKSLPSWDDHVSTKRRDGISYVKLVQGIIKNETNPIRQKMIARWKFLRRRLDPQDPYIADTMYLYEGTKEE